MSRLTARDRLTISGSDHHSNGGQLALTFDGMKSITMTDARLTSSELRQHRDPGEMLFLEGQAPSGVYVLHSGEVELLFAARNGKAKPLRLVSSGQILGLSAVVMRRRHDCSAIARTPCEIGFIDRGEFLRLLEECPGLWLSVLRLLSNDVHAVYDDMRALTAGAGDARHIAG
jgi:CRP-like cAMP-binding protein